MMLIRSILRRLPSVTYSRGKYRVYGSAAEIVMMCAACVLALEQRGLDTNFNPRTPCGVRLAAYESWVQSQ